MLYAEILLASLLIFVVVLIISALPLYFAVSFLGGKVSLFKAMLMTLVSSIILFILDSAYRFWGKLLVLILLIWIYHEVFRLKWHKAFLAWILQMLFVLVFYIIGLFIAGLFIGSSLFYPFF